MKKTWNFIKNFTIITYIVIIIFITICLLSFNDYRVTVFGDTTLIPIIDEDLQPEINKGDLLVLKKDDPYKVNVGDEVFFYRTFAGHTTTNLAKIKKVEPVTPTEVTFFVDGDYMFSSSNFIGKKDTANVIPVVGSIMQLLESKWGFLFLGVFPSMIAFLYTVYSIIMEFYDNEQDKKKKKKKKKSKTKKVVEEKENDEIEESKIDEKESKEKTDDKPIEKKEAEVVETKKVEVKEKTAEEVAKDETSKETKKELVKESVDNKIDKEIKAKEKTTISKEEKMNKEVDNKEVIKDNSKKVENDENAKKRAIIEEKMKQMTPEEKKALLEAKLKSMTPEEKKALIEAKRKKIEAQKNNK